MIAILNIMKHIIALSAFCSVLMAGCQQSEDGLEVKEEYPVFIEASIGGVGASRYTGSAPNSAAFENGDLIGLAYEAGEETTGFVKWDLKNGNWKPDGVSMTWKNLGEDHTFYAFYPYDFETSVASLSEIPMPNLANQNGTMTSVASCDFLVATKTMKYSSDGIVSFTGDNAFGHVSSLLVLTLKNAGDLASATINNISLTGTDLVAASIYSFTNKPVTLVNGGTSDDTMSASWEDGIAMGEDKVFYFVVNSGTVDLSAVDLSITYKSESGEVYKATKEGLNTVDGHQKFLGGYSYNYGVTITTGNELSISNHAIKTWESGDSFDITINGEKQ